LKLYKIDVKDTDSIILDVKLLPNVSIYSTKSFRMSVNDKVLTFHPNC